MTRHFSKIKEPDKIKSDIWNSLKFVKKIPNIKIKSVMNKREQLKTKLSEQILMAADRSYAPTKNKWITDADGHVRRVALPVKVARWWSEVESGKVQIYLYFKGKILELEPEKDAIEVSSLNDLIPTFRSLQKSIDLGDFDDLLK